MLPINCVSNDVRGSLLDALALLSDLLRDLWGTFAIVLTALPVFSRGLPLRGRSQDQRASSIRPYPVAAAPETRP